MARTEINETPAGPHEFGDLTVTTVMSGEEWEAFQEYMSRPRRVCSNTLIELLKEKKPWEK